MGVGATSWDDPIRVPDRWRQLWRELHGWTCAEVATQMGLGRYVGTYPRRNDEYDLIIPGTGRFRHAGGTVGRFERGSAEPNPDQLEHWLATLDYMVDHPHRDAMRWLSYQDGLYALGDPPRPRDRVWLLFDRVVRARLRIPAHVRIDHDTDVFSTRSDVSLERSRRHWLRGGRDDY